MTILLPDDDEEEEEEKVASAEFLLSKRRFRERVKSRTRAASSFCERKLPRVVPLVWRRDDDDDKDDDDDDERSISRKNIGKKKWSKKKERVEIFKKKKKRQKTQTYMGGGNAEFGFGQDEDDEDEDLWANVDARFAFVFFSLFGVFLSKRISLSVDFKEGETRARAFFLSFWATVPLFLSLSSFVFVALTHTLFLSLSFFLALSMRTVTLTPSSSKRWRAGNEAKVVPERAAGTRR